MQDQDYATTSLPAPSGLYAVRDRLILKLVDRELSRHLRGRIALTLPSGCCRVIGSGHHFAQVEIRALRAIGKCIRRGTLGFAEAYFADEIITPDLAAVFAFFIDNREVLERAGRGMFQVRGKDKTYHRARANTRQGSKQNISEHYDLGNAFYSLWLDPGMSYSSGIYLGQDTTLCQSQVAKYNAIIEALELTAGDRVLEIGCGWGGFIEAAAKAGADVDAITISHQQLNHARGRITACSADWNGAAEARFEDYRDTRGQYDKLASIEMVEAVGEENWPQYFSTVHDRLKPGGLAAIQAITIRESSFDHYRSKPDFIQRYIFPGGMLPTPTHMREQAEAAGLEFLGSQPFGLSYARTLAEWRSRFHAQWPQIEPLGFDSYFRRLWDYYLTYCEVGFERGVIDVAIFQYRRPDVA